MMGFNHGEYGEVLTFVTTTTTTTTTINLIYILWPKVIHKLHLYTVLLPAVLLYCLTASSTFHKYHTASSIAVLLYC